MNPFTPIAAAVSIAGRHGVHVTDPVVLKDSFNIRVHLRPAPIVARIPTVTTLGRPRPLEALAREVAVVSFLAEKGAPVVPVSDLMPPGPFEQDGYAVSFWTYVEHDGDRRLEPADVGGALADLHHTLREYPGELLYLGPALEETTRLLDMLDAPPGVDRGALAELRDDLGLLTVELSGQPGPVQAVHGDAHPGNLLAAPEGLLWIDFEETCSGPAGWDLACLLRSGRLDGRQAVQRYGVDPDDPSLRPLLRARMLQGTLWMLAKARRFPQEAGRAKAALDEWRQARG
uniref:aminoglycoside phosphotransferase family protein n=1 Tax=Herbidospora sakaeratensis TaxID=564415 RepID=UPI0007863A54|nr:aminoglycoside phosphotransferase family protein [Herbidospora sakaeratensis]